MYQADAIRLLIRRFSDPDVGYVVGQARYTRPSRQAAAAESEGFYWRLETWLKQKESEFGSVVGGDGAIYAIRRELFVHLLPTDINDFLNPLQIIARGYRGVYEATAICFEEAGDSFQKEFRRKVRIISRSLNAVRREPRVLLPWIQPRHWWALLSHKILRWFGPVFQILLMLVTITLLDVRVFWYAFWLQICFYALAAIGALVQASSKAPKIFSLPYYLCVVNLASLFGILKFATGSLSPTWQTIRQDQPAQGDDPQLARKGS
jgi:cellulose synthase/poly-beta-1,6-N-acetylglucosamine synthase-like glycosyltransferase